MEWIDIMEGQTPASVEELDRAWDAQLEWMASQTKEGPFFGRTWEETLDMLRAAVEQLKQHGAHTLSHLWSPLLLPYERCLNELEAQGKFVRPRLLAGKKPRSRSSRYR